MPTQVAPAAISRARKLRRSMTEGERKLWSELKTFRRLYGVHVRKQAPIGPYVVDFVVQSKKLVIEVDGEFHVLTSRKESDRQRDDWLRAQGYSVLRLSTGDLSDAFDGCIEEILRAFGVMEGAR